MDYKKLYEKAVERAKTLTNSGFNDFDFVKHIFPELAESENEKIRKAISDILLIDNDEIREILDANNVLMQDIDAWLEKQGEKKQEVRYVYTKFRIGDVIVEIKPNGYCQPIRVKYVGEGAYSCESDDRKRSLSFPVTSQDEYKLVEQKPADKVEPKFEIKEGKWYVCIRDLLDNYANKAFCKGGIYLSTQNGSLIPSNSNVPFEVVCPDTYFKDWTIQDANDGDVLSYRNGQWIFIYKEKIDDKSFYYHALYSTIHQDLTIYDAGFTLLDIAIVPATKEQRDTLFAKMKEAGYEWNAEKLELKKVEQKPWSEEDELHIRELESLVKQVWATAEHENDKDTIHKMSDLSFFLKTLKPQLKQDLDEEDENNILFLTSIIEECFKDKEKITLHSDTVYANFTKEDVIDRLKSLKNRVHPKPVEWNEEDRKMMRNIIDDIHCGTNFNPKVMHAANEREKWFKSICMRYQSKWKPSLSQMNALSIVSKGNAPDDIEAIVSLYQDLKKLREE